MTTQANTAVTFSAAAAHQAICEAFGDRRDELEIHAELLKIQHIHAYLEALSPVVVAEPQTGYPCAFYDTMPDALAVLFLSDDFLEFDTECGPREFQPHGVCAGDDIVKWHVRLESNGQGCPLPFENGEAGWYDLEWCWNYVNQEEELLRQTAC
jgi:hypothetical protein